MRDRPGDIADIPSRRNGKFTTLHQRGKEIRERINGLAFDGGPKPLDDTIQASANRRITHVVVRGKVLQRPGPQHKLHDEVEVFAGKTGESVVRKISGHV